MSQFKLINQHLVEITANDEIIYAKKGAMVACQGDIHFYRSFLTGNGLQQVAAQAVTNEMMVMMAAQGTGKVFYAYNRRCLTVLEPDEDTLYIESDKLLAFDHGFRVGSVFLGNKGLVQGVIKGAVTDQGLFTTTLKGKGRVCILSDGSCVALEVSPDKPIYVDPDAYIGHRGELSSKFTTDINWKTFIGQASGESYQIKFIGRGTVYIQASERK